MKDISVLIVTGRRTEKLKWLLESIMKFADPRLVEVRVLINGEDREAQSLLQGFQRSCPYLHYMKVSRVNRGEARNILIKASEGKIVYFLDDDVEIGKDVFTLILEKFKTYEGVCILSGPNLNMPQSRLFQRCQGYVLASFFGTLWISQRYKKAGSDRRVDESNLILCNLAIKREAFDRTEIRFSHHCVSAEENLLLAELQSRGYQAMYIPELEVYHERRASCRGFCRQIFGYGKGRAQIFKAAPRYIKPVHFLPALFIFYLLSLVCFIHPSYGMPLASYLFLTFLFSCKMAFQYKELRLLPLAFCLYPCVHLSYGCGFLSGIVSRNKEAAVYA